MTKPVTGSITSHEGRFGSALSKPNVSVSELSGSVKKGETSKGIKAALSEPFCAGKKALGSDGPLGSEGSTGTGASLAP